MLLLGCGRSGLGETATVPTVASAYVPTGGGNLTIVFSQPVTGFEAESACGFAAVATTGAVDLSYVSGDGTAEVLFGLARTIYAGELLSLTYTPGTIAAVTGGLPLEAIFVPIEATNNSTQENEFPMVLNLTEGSGTLTIPFGCTQMTVECYGAGGGGGGGGWNALSEQYEPGGGGGGGGYGKSTVTEVVNDPGYYSWYVGSGGSPGSPGDGTNPGGQGGSGSTTQVNYSGVELLCNGEGGQGGYGGNDGGPGGGGLGGVYNNGNDMTTNGGDGSGTSGGSAGAGGPGYGGSGGGTSPDAGAAGGNGLLVVTYTNA